MATNGVQQVKPLYLQPEALDPHVPAAPLPTQGLSRGEVMLRNLAGPAVLDFPEDDCGLAQAERIRRKREQRKIREQTALAKFFKPHVVTEQNVNLPIDSRRMLLRCMFPCSSTERLWPLHLAAKSQNLEIVRNLLKMQADPQQKTSHGRTALEILTSSDAVEDTNRRLDNANQIELLLSSGLMIQSASEHSEKSHSRPRHMLSCCCWGANHADNVVFVDGCRDAPESEALESIALPEGTFAVELQREASATSTLGLDLDKMDRQNLMVVKTQPGLVSEYNKLAASDEVIRKGDRIWRVNGKTGSADELLEMLATDKKLHLLISRCKEKEVYVEKKGKTLGIQLVVTEKASCLTVEKVNPGGLVATLNEKTSDDRQIRVHDKIVAVDGIQGLAPELMKQIKEKDSFILKLFSWDMS